MIVKLRQPQNAILVIIIVISVGLRLASAFYLGNDVENMPGTYDQISYHTLAIRVIEGYGFSFEEAWWPLTAAGEPTAHWSFIYTFYLAFVYLVFGPNPLIARLIQAIIVGILHPYLVYRIAKEIFSSPVALIAAAITAVYIYFVYYSGALMTEPFYITAILGSLLLAIQLAQPDAPPTAQYSKTGKLLFSIFFGLLLGLTVLLRQLYMLIIPFLFLWIFWARLHKRLPLPWQELVISIIVIAATILPFTYYNWLRFDRFVLLNTNSGYAFYWGNHPIYGTKFIPILPEEMGSYGDLVPRELLGLSESELESELLKRGIQFVFDDPIRYARLSVSRIPAYFMFWPSKESSTISNFSRIGSFGIFFPFMLYGLWLAIKQKKGSWLRFTSHPMFVLLLFSTLYTVIHLLTWALIRYRLPVDAVLLIFAGLAVVKLASPLIQRMNFLQHLMPTRM